ncbi:MAG: OmpA family protein [Deltaproteobacteria bacterium]|nr:OmpA family protein [Deltaproteobacteria bacterium]
MRGRWFVGFVLLLAGCPPRHSYPDGAGLAGQLEREVVALQQRVRSLEFQLDHCGEDPDPDSIYQDLHQIFSGSDVLVSRVGSTTILLLPSDYLFTRGTDLREEALMSLDLLATALNLHPEHQVVVEGHSDDRMPTGDLRRLYSDNWVLSYSRAETVMHALSTQFGVDPSRFTVQSRAEWEPIATNDTTAGQAKNRRVMVRIIPPKRPYILE